MLVVVMKAVNSMRKSLAMAKFIKVTTSERFDVIINTDTIKYIERNPNDTNSVWIWTDWANNGYIVARGNFEFFKEKLGA